jgi:phosphohistidine phosphatase SixA/8-oxo-dGTP pyrophosphatase MutT (NUDIX family)
MPADLSEPVLAAGAVLWRVTSSAGLEIALIHRPKYDDWSLPKGKLTDGEHVLTAAVREVEEETGVAARLGRPLPTQHYLVEGVPKEVWYWSAQARTDGTRAFSAGDEVDELLWLAVGDAERRLTNARDSGVLAAFTAAPIATTPLLLLRHTSAVKRSEWAYAEAIRPLTEKGTREAELLAPLLAAYGVEQLVCSNTRRCTDTLRPYIEAHGLRRDDEPLFSESGYQQYRDQALERAMRLLTIDRPTVVCSHRPVLPDLVVLLCRRSGIDPPTRGLKAGAFWVLHLADGRVVDIEEHDPRGAPPPVSPPKPLTGDSAPRVPPEPRPG